MVTYAFQFSIRQLTIPTVESFHVKDGILPRTLGTKRIPLFEFVIFKSLYIFRTILLSVVSLLNEPNTYSPANVDASVMFRRWKDSKGKDKEYENIIRYEFSLCFYDGCTVYIVTRNAKAISSLYIQLCVTSTFSFSFCRKQVQASRLDAEKDGVVVPTTMEEYCMKAKPMRPAQDSIEMDDFYDDELYDMDDEDDDEDEDLSDNEEKEANYDDAEDSGNGES